MQIQKKKHSKVVEPTGGSFTDNDFASGFEDGKFEKFKPAIKALVVIVLLVGTVWGAVAYFGGTDENNDANKNYSSNTSQPDEDIAIRFTPEKCLKYQFVILEKIWIWRTVLWV